MTLDEGRKLLARYASGSLTKAESSLLSQAAMEHEEIFKELARLHAQMTSPAEIVSETSRRKPKHVPWWQRQWVWGMVVAVAIVAVLIARLPRTSSLHEEATPLVEQAAATAPPVATPPPTARAISPPANAAPAANAPPTATASTSDAASGSPCRDLPHPQCCEVTAFCARLLGRVRRTPNVKAYGGRILVGPGS